MNAEQYKIKDYSPKFAKKTVTVMRKITQRAFGELADDSFDKQVNHFKNVIAKQYAMRIVTSFNERTIYGVVIFDQSHLIELLVDPAKKNLGIEARLLKIVQQQSQGVLECDTANRQLKRFLIQNEFQEVAADHLIWRQTSL